MKTRTVARIAASVALSASAAAAAGAVALHRHLDRISKADDSARLPRGLVDLAGQTFAVEPYTDLTIKRAEASHDALLSVNAWRRRWSTNECEQYRRRAEIARLTSRVPSRLRTQLGLPCRPTPPYSVVIDGARVTNCREHPAVNLRSVSNVLVENGWFM